MSGHESASGVVFRAQRGPCLKPVAKGASGLEQYDRKDDRLEKARLDKCLLEYLDTELIRTRFSAPLRHGETWSVGGNEL